MVITRILRRSNANFWRSARFTNWHVGCTC